MFRVKNESSVTSDRERSIISKHGQIQSHWLLSLIIIQSDRPQIHSHITHHRSQITDHRSQIRDQRSQIRDQRSQITDQRSQITDQRSQIRDQRSEITDQRSEITDQRSQIRDHRSQTRDQKSQIRDQRSEIGHWDFSLVCFRPKQNHLVTSLVPASCQWDSCEPVLHPNCRLDNRVVNCSLMSSCVNDSKTLGAPRWRVTSQTFTKSTMKASAEPWWCNLCFIDLWPLWGSPCCKSLWSLCSFTTN